MVSLPLTSPTAQELSDLPALDSGGRGRMGSVVGGDQGVWAVWGGGGQALEAGGQGDAGQSQNEQARVGSPSHMGLGPWGVCVCVCVHRTCKQRNQCLERSTQMKIGQIWSHP